MSATILVADDDEMFRELVTEILTQGGYAVVRVKDGAEGWEALQHKKIDLAVLDLNMPNMDGLELIKKVREEGKHRFTPIVMLTTESSEEKKKAGREAGASGWIVKPFKPEQLLKVVKMVLGE